MADLPISDSFATKTAPARFQEPWHAGLFAITMDLCDNGHFTWPEWTKAFGARLKAAVNAGGPQDGSDYYGVWLEALEAVLTEKGIVSAGGLASVKAAWTAAYLETPHGEPVRLERWVLR